MATKSSSKKRSKKKPAAAAVAPKAKPKQVDLKKLNEALGERLDEQAGWRSKFKEQEERVDIAEALAELERQKLDQLGKGLLLLDGFLDSPEYQRLFEAMPYDGDFKTLTAKVVTKKPRWEGSKPTGAKPWAELIRYGASDGQIEKNLRNVEIVYSNKFDFNRDQLKFKKYVEHNGRGRISVPLLQGKKANVDAARRIYGIPQPGEAPAPKPATSGRKKPAAKKSAKPATARKKKPAAKPKSPTAAKPPAKPKPAVVKKTTTAKAKSPTAKKKATIAADVERESRTLDMAWEALKKNGPGEWSEVAKCLPGPIPIAITTCLDKLVALGRATVDGKIFKAVEQEVAEDTAKPDKWWEGEIDSDLEKAIKAALPKVWQALNELGRSTDEELQKAKFPRWHVDEVDFFLEELYRDEHIETDGKKNWAIGDGPGAPAKITDVTTKATASDPLEVLKLLGPTPTVIVASRIGKSVDATGSQLRRLLKAGKVKQVGNEWQLVGAASINPATKAADAELNGTFEQSLRDKGKHHKILNETMEDLLDGTTDDRDDADVGAEALRNERERRDQINEVIGKGGPVVVDRRTKKNAKGLAVHKPK